MFQYDATNAFLNAKIDRLVYVHTPIGFVDQLGRLRQRRERNRGFHFKRKWRSWTVSQCQALQGPGDWWRAALCRWSAEESVSEQRSSYGTGDCPIDRSIGAYLIRFLAA
ncbi:hypothetical protein EJ04DRAFT_506039 [Polyplosphaeria fusca]|uniref:Reverse transcriptase n=1 Tax=Polyplosphaeria fusca TaxID=682080 RepID=A0A9P4QK72_9PLEO|nr:hypothetical protein EJ04DRAFT_506039 [Polyplosphaeria fusca]